MKTPEEIQRLHEAADHLAKRINELREVVDADNEDAQAMATASIKREVERCRALLGEIEAEYLPINDLIHEKYTESPEPSRCCGRCDGVNDLCVTDTVCEMHNFTGCELCFGERIVKQKMKTIKLSEPDVEGDGRMSCYPTDAELEKIKKWDAVKSPRSLVEFIHDIWWTPEFGFNLQKGFITDKIFRKTVKKLSLSTGGWSGNESIIYALQENIFWALYWIKSERGGHYEFYIPKENWEFGKETEG